MNDEMRDEQTTETVIVTARGFVPFTVVSVSWYGNVLLLTPETPHGQHGSDGGTGQTWSVLALDNSLIRHDVWVADDADVVLPEDLPTSPADAIATMHANLYGARNALTVARSEHIAFRTRVRDQIIRGWEISNRQYGSDMCVAGLNDEMLRPLGLDEYSRTFRVSITVRADVEADDQDSAEDVLRDAIEVSDSRCEDIDVS